ncbi:hypothetical protein BV20DRAFT_800137 [Pilatotrama ljubarskyi]|nr:hypothetical protein BV20DRAFT_800137 [Pilatotrama ljubarskyi]
MHMRPNGQRDVMRERGLAGQGGTWTGVHQKAGKLSGGILRCGSVTAAQNSGRLACTIVRLRRRASALAIGPQLAPRAVELVRPTYEAAEERTRFSKHAQPPRQGAVDLDDASSHQGSPRPSRLDHSWWRISLTSLSISASTNTSSGGPA